MFGKKTAEESGELNEEEAQVPLEAAAEEEAKKTRREEVTIELETETVFGVGGPMGKGHKLRARDR